MPKCPWASRIAPNVLVYGVKKKRKVTLDTLVPVHMSVSAWQQWIESSDEGDECAIGDKTTSTPHQPLAPLPPGWNLTLQVRTHLLFLLLFSLPTFIPLCIMLCPWSGYPVFHGVRFRDSCAGGKNDTSGDIWWQRHQWLLVNVYLFRCVKHVEL